MDDITRLRTQAETAGTESTKLQESIPGLLSGLKSNLTSIFTKDNPMMQQRESALETFLNVPSQTRASLLPSNMPTVEGSPLNLSPTQQSAITTASRNAALVPLAGLNQSIVGQYGNLADVLQNAGGIFQTQAEVAKQKAANALNLYKGAIDEYNAVTSRQKINDGGGGLDLTALLTALLGQNQQETDTQDEWEVIETPQAPASPIDFRSQPLQQAQQPSFWDNLLGLFGATPRQGLEQPVQPGGLNLTGYNFGNVPIKLGV